MEAQNCSKVVPGGDRSFDLLEHLRALRLVDRDLGLVSRREQEGLGNELFFDRGHGVLAHHVGLFRWHLAEPWAIHGEKALLHVRVGNLLAVDFDEDLRRGFSSGRLGSCLRSGLGRVLADGGSH